jgi:hypothetical protein
MVTAATQRELVSWFIGEVKDPAADGQTFAGGGQTFAGGGHPTSIPLAQKWSRFQHND